MVHAPESLLDLLLISVAVCCKATTSDHLGAIGINAEPSAVTFK